MDHIVIEGVAPWDGRYELDTNTEFTTREWGWIKRLTGYLPLTLDDSSFGDPELLCALAVIAVHRAGKIERQEVPTVFDRLIDAPFGTTITIETGEELEQDGDADGPPLRSSNGNEPTSGLGSTTSSETSALTQPPSGTPGSDSSESLPVTPSVI